MISNSSSHYIGLGVGGTSGVVLTAASLFSVRTRCSMVLMIPSILTKRGRGFIFTFITGLLVDGPIDTIEKNLQEVIRSFTCMYDQMKRIGDHFLSQFEVTFSSLADIMKTVAVMVTEMKHTIEEHAKKSTRAARDKLEKTKKDIQKQIDKIKSDIEEMKPKGFFKYLNNACSEVENLGNEVNAGTRDFSAVAGGAIQNTLQRVWKPVESIIGNIFGRRKRRSSCIVDKPTIKINLTELGIDFMKYPPDMNIVDIDFDDIPSIKGPNMKHIREQMKAILQKAVQFGKHVAKWISKIFYISILRLIVDAIKFMRNYYSDDEFDNMFIDGNIERLWKIENMEELTPMRRWELNSCYQISTSFKLKREEVKEMFIELIPTIVFTMSALGLLIADFSFSSALEAFRKNAKFGFTFEGLENGITLNSLKSKNINTLTVQPFNLTTDPCLPVPTSTNPTNLSVVLLLLTFCAITCFLNAYMARLRSRICNQFFPERASERGKYLFKKIQAGRRTRHHQLQMILKREYNIKRRSEEFQGVFGNMSRFVMFKVSGKH